MTTARLLAASLALLLPTVPTVTASAQRFEITVSRSARDEPVTGRV